MRRWRGGDRLLLSYLCVLGTVSRIGACTKVHDEVKRDLLHRVTTSQAAEVCFDSTLYHNVAPASLGKAHGGGPAVAMPGRLVVSARSVVPRRISAASILGALPPVRLMFVAVAVAALAIPALRHHPRLAVLELQRILRTGHLLMMCLYIVSESTPGRQDGHASGRWVKMSSTWAAALAARLLGSVAGVTPPL